MTAATLGLARLGNFRLGYTARMAALNATRARILLSGVDARTRIAGLTIRDVLNDAPNTCSLNFDGNAWPVPEQTLRVLINRDAPRLLFNGAVQRVDLKYEGWPVQRVFPSTAIDDTARANRMRPFGTWTNVSATTVATQIMAAFAPGFTTVHVQAGLPAVTVILDGTEGMSGALKLITTQIGGYFYFEDGDLHLFIEETATTPDPIDGTPGRLLDDPPILITRDDSQLRTRQYGRAHGEQLQADVLAGETILPVENAAAWFGSIGGAGKAIALSQRLAYTGVRAGSGGSLVGPGATPNTRPTVGLLAGVGLGTGVYQHAYTYLTASGESLPSPLSSIVTGVSTPPAAALTAAIVSGAGVNDGNHDYAVTFFTASGETTPSPVSNAVTAGVQSIGLIADPTAAPVMDQTIFGAPDYGLGTFQAQGSTVDGYYVRITFINATGETACGPPVYCNMIYTYPVHFSIKNIPVGPAGTTSKGIYFYFYGNNLGAGNSIACYRDVIANAATTWTTPSGPTFYGYNTTGRSVNTTGTPTAFNQVALTSIPNGGAEVTGKRLYRRFNGAGLFKLVAALAANATTYTDTTPNASLGAAAPAANTATACQINLTAISTGPTGTTGRRVYRTSLNGAQLKVLVTLADNTTTTYADATADGALGANAPVSDTSGLTQPPGQVNAGSIALLMASAAPFPATGGWVLQGGQAIRYTGRTGNTLTGIPATGPGAILTTILYGAQVLPAGVLLGVTGVAVPILKGTPISIWVQRDDLAAQLTQKAVDTANGIVPADGIYEGPPLVDDRRNEASMNALCDATLIQSSTPIVTVTYDCRDVKTKSGRTIVIDLENPPIHETLTIQEVTITEIDIAPALAPRFSVVASNVRHSLDDILRRLLNATDSTTA